ncbi:ABC transporter substrate-binding protein [Bosea sp. (in: a-proteobacteria)]|uniref:ABC transporter substrate-binding protein n=1 Tax=Bosea sp. (in: a-proteobacteria) TaxID=1871050 RepID=UPI003B3BC94F
MRFFNRMRRLAVLAVPAMLAFPITGAWAQQPAPFKIGVLSDMSGMVADLSGPGTVAAVKLAVEDFGGSVLNRPIQVLEADHLNKPDVGVTAARAWYDEGVSAIFDIGLTSIALGVQELARDKNKLVVFLSSASSDLTRKNCSPNGIHWTYNNYSQALGVTRFYTKSGAKTWYFMTVDYAFGVNTQRDTTAMIEAAGGKVVGATRHPFDIKDFSSDLLKAQGSGADVIALATTTAHVAGLVKQADEFGIRPAQKIAPLSLTLHDVKALGLQAGQGLLVTAPYYWDQNDETRAFAKRYFDRFKKMPNMIQASAYGAVLHYLNAVKAVGVDDASKVAEKMKQTPINDFMTKNGRIREDGRAIRDMYIFRVKSPAASKSEWDIYETLEKIPAEEAFQKADPVCSLVKG